MSETTGRRLPASFGPRPGHLRRAEINRQVEALVHRLMTRVGGLNVALSHGTLSEEVRLDGTLTTALAHREPMARQQAARLIGAHLLDHGEKDDPAFWATDLGRAIAREIGWIHPAPTRVVARNVLDVTRQGVDQMVKRGDLDAGTDGISPCVTRESLQAAAAKRWPYETDI